MPTKEKTLTYKDFAKLNDRLIQKLRFWCGKRIGHSWHQQTYSDIVQKRLNKEVEQYITELVIERPTQKTLVQWLAILSNQEKAAIVGFIQFDSTGTFTDRKALDMGWYSLTLQQGEYAVVTEPVLDGFNFEGVETGIITKNAYDCEVLNTNTMMILDVDLPGDGVCNNSHIAWTEHQAISVLKAWVEESPDYGFRVYRTAAGLRHVCTTHEFYPTDPDAHKMMRLFYTDPLYMRLCKFQECFRARLTPKPWRSAYDDEDYTTCQLISVVGSQKAIEPFMPLIVRHDEQTKALEPVTILA